MRGARRRDGQHAIEGEVGGNIGPRHTEWEPVLSQELSGHKAVVVLEQREVGTSERGSVFWLLLRTHLSAFVLPVNSDELVRDVDGQLIGGEVLHIQVNHIAVLLQAHLYGEDSRSDP